MPAPFPKSWSVLRFAACCLLPIPFLYLLFFYHLDQRDLWSSHEARAAQNAQVIVETGNWALPRLFDGRVEMQKPPLFYWLVAAAAWLRGGTVDAWAVRVPSTLAAMLGMAAVFLLAWRRGRPLAGALAALVLGTMLHYTWMGRVGRTDMPLTAAVCISLLGLYLGWRSPRRSKGSRVIWLLAGYSAAAAAFLLKGPIGVVLPATVVVCSVAVKRLNRCASKSPAPNFTTFFGRNALGLSWGVPLFLLLVTPWFLYANHQTHGEFFREFFWRHNLQRGLGGDLEMDGHEHPFWFYAAHMWVDMLPWSLLVPAAAIYLLRRGRWRKDAEAQFGGLWFLLMLGFLSLMHYKRPDYLLPAYPGLALAIGCVVERWSRAWSDAWLRRAGAVFALGSIAIAAGWVLYVDVFLPRWEPARELRRFAAAVRECVPQPGQVLGFRIDSHQLAYHLGRPLERLWEWENLDIWACQPAPVYVVMPADCAGDWQRFMEAGKLFPVLSTTTVAGRPHEHPVVLLCTRPPKP